MIFNFGENIKQMREGKGLTAEYVAAKMGISCSEFKKIEKQTMLPSPSFLISFPSAIGIDFIEMMDVLANSVDTENLPEKSKEKFSKFIDVFNAEKAVYQKEMIKVGE